jgi:polar amino acid transport system substrate-binding protein
MKKCFLKRFALVLLILVQCVSLIGCNVKEDKSFQSIEDFESAVIGVMNGSSFDLLASEYYPTAEKRYLNMPDLILNLQQEKINGILMDMGFYTPIIWEGESLSYIEMDMPATEYAVAFPKAAESEALMAQFNEFIRSETENGGLAELEAKWLSASEPDGSIDFTQLTGENGTLHVATTVESKPFSYLKDGKYYGYDADFLFRFAKEYGYALRIDQIDFGALLPGLTAGRFDLAVSGITVTEERRETVLFSDAYYRSPIIMAVLADEPATGGEKTLVDLERAKIGIITGTNYDNVAKEKFPDAERMYFSTSADVLLALEQGKIDACFADKTLLASMRWENQKVDYIDEPVEMISNALILAKEEYDPYLLAQLNEFIGNSKNNGTLERLEEKWVGDTEPSEHPDYTKLTGENGTLKIAVSDSLKPVSYQKGSMYTGYEVDFLTLFAEEYGYKLEIQGMAFDALIPSVASGKCDIGASAITITPERAESVTFTDPHFETYGVAVIHDNFSAKNVKTTLEDFINVNLGVVTGSIYDGHSKAIFPDAKIAYYQTFADLFQCVQQGKIDGFMADKPNFNSVKRVSSNLSALKVPDLNVEIGYGFQKNDGGDKLKAEMDAFIAELKADGTIDKLIEKWYGDTEPTQTLEKPDFSDNKTTISVAVDTGRNQFVYMLNNEYAGFEAELM